MYLISYILAEVSYWAAGEWKRCYRLFVLTRVPAYTSQTSVNNLETRYDRSYWTVCTFSLYSSSHLIIIAHLNVIVIIMWNSNILSVLYSS